MANVAGLIETFKMPMREIEAKYTRSELTITAWRSQETSSNLKDRSKRVPEGSGANGGYSVEDLANRITDKQMEAIERKLGPVVTKIENKDGEVDLRQLTGDEALHFMNVLGMPMGRGLG